MAIDPFHPRYTRRRETTRLLCGCCAVAIIGLHGVSESFIVTPRIPVADGLGGAAMKRPAVRKTPMFTTTPTTTSISCSIASTVPYITRSDRRIMITQINQRNGQSVEDWEEILPVEVDLTALKNNLLQIAALSERGNLASLAMRDDIEIITKRLEQGHAMNSHQQPRYDNGQMKGEWVLVYSSSQTFRSSPFFASLQMVVGQALSSRLFQLSGVLPAVRVEQAYQEITSDGKELISRVEVSFFPFRRLLRGVVQTTASIVNEDIGDRLEVIVQNTGLIESTVGRFYKRLNTARVSVDKVFERVFDKIPKVTIETVFLDSNMRISRLPDSSLLIYVKPPVY